MENYVTDLLQTHTLNDAKLSRESFTLWNKPKRVRIIIVHNMIVANKNATNLVFDKSLGNSHFLQT